MYECMNQDDGWTVACLAPRHAPQDSMLGARNYQWRRSKSFYDEPSSSYFPPYCDASCIQHIAQRLCPHSSAQQSGLGAHCAEPDWEEEEVGDCRETCGATQEQDKEDQEPEEYSLYEIYDKIRKLAMKKYTWSNMKVNSCAFEPLFRIKGAELPEVTINKVPHNIRNLIRQKPYERHQMYQRKWKLQPPVGEADRYAVAFAMRKKMHKIDKVKEFHKIYVPNLYVVPTLKPRYKLRMAVRKCNKHFIMPPCGIFHEVVDFG